MDTVHIYWLALSVVFWSAVLAWGLQWINSHHPAFFDDYTWVSVVIGTGMVILHTIPIIGFDDFLKVFFLFACGGFVQIMRSILIDIERRTTTENGHDDKQKTETVARLR